MKAAETFELPDWIDAQTWADFEEMRRKIRRPITDAGRRLAVKRLMVLQSCGHNPNEVLEQSILNSWQGLWPIQESRTGQKEADARKEVNVGRNWISDNLELQRKVAILAKKKAM